MVSDLIFSVLPREGQVTIEKDQFRVEQVAKEARISEGDDHAKDVATDEREARQHEQHHSANKAKSAETEQNDEDDNSKDGHLDIYV